MHRRIPIFLSLLVSTAIAQNTPQMVTGGKFSDDNQTSAIRNCSADGVVVNALTNQPIPRARVFMRGPMSVTADATGRFSAENVFCGAFSASATRAGFLTNSAGQFAGSGRPVGITLAPGTAAHNYQILLVPQSVVTGLVTDDQGDPIPNAPISIYTSRVIQGRRSLQSATATNSNDLGEFRIAGLAAGKYVLCAHANSNPIAIDDVIVPGEKCYPGPIDGGVVSTFDLQAGRDVRIPLSLPSVPMVRVRGRVVGLPKSRGVSVSLVRRGIAGDNMNRTGGVTPEGKFDVHGVTSGSYSLNVDYWEDNNRYMARVPVDVASSDVDDITVNLSQGFIIHGTVKIDSKDAAIPSGPPVSVSLRSSDPMAGGGRLVWGPDGASFTLADVTPGTYQLESFGGGRFFVKQAMYNGRDISRENVSITQPGGAIELLVSDVGGTLEGQVVNREGTGQSGWVMVEDGGRIPRPLIVDDSGNFRVPNVPPGNYTLYAWDDFSQVEYANPEWMRRYGAGEKVTVEAGQTAHVKLIRQQALSQ